jgi:uncharacterized membrane protein
MITLHWLYALAGAMFAAFALLSALDNPAETLRQRRLLGTDGAEPLGGDAIGDFGNGLLVLGLAGLAGFGFIGRSQPPTTSDAERDLWSQKLGNKLFLPALIIPATALIGTLAYNYTALGSTGWIEPKRETYVFLGLGVLFALAAIFAWLRPPPSRRFRRAAALSTRSAGPRSCHRCSPRSASCSPPPGSETRSAH